MAEQLGFYIDSSICSGCKACQVACKDKNDEIATINYRKPYFVETGGFTKGNNINTVVYSLSIACNHCGKPACVEICPTKSMQKDKQTGIVDNDKELCIGCGSCLEACPYKAPTVNETLEKAFKCDMCKDLLAQSQQPMCVESCPLKAIECGDIKELRKKYGNIADVHGLPSSKKTAPNLVLKLHKGAK